MSVSKDLVPMSDNAQHVDAELAPVADAILRDARQSFELACEDMKIADSERDLLWADYVNHHSEWTDGELRKLGLIA